MRRGYDFFDSPIGRIYVVVGEMGVLKVELFQEDWEDYLEKNPGLERNVRLCEEAILQLEEYFKGQRREFDLPMVIMGTPFREAVWKALIEIPYGEVRSYQDVALAIGNPKAVRAIGQANKGNQLPIIIPCHRVIGKSGKLVGFAGDRTPTQQLLLDIEKSTTYE